MEPSQAKCIFLSASIVGEQNVAKNAAAVTKMKVRNTIFWQRYLSAIAPNNGLANMPMKGITVYITPTVELLNPSCFAYVDKKGTTGPVPIIKIRFYIRIF